MLTLTLVIALVPTIGKPDHSKFGRFCPDFKWFLTKLRPFVQISTGWASGWISDFISNPDHLQPDLFWTIQNQD